MTMTADALDYYYPAKHIPLGPLRLRANAHGLTEVAFVEISDVEASDIGVSSAESTVEPPRPNAHTQACHQQLAEYFTGQRQVFDLLLAPKGTPFQQRVWQALLEIPFGSTASYAELAANLGSPRAVRAVGTANGRNPLAIIVPCHRVIGSDGSLTGYAGGLPRKRWLLEHEKSDLLSPPESPTTGNFT